MLRNLFQRIEESRWNMLYEIRGEYYIRIGRKYIKVNVEYKNNNIDVVPSSPKVVIEDNGNIKYTEHVINENFKKRFVNKSSRVYDKPKYND